MNRAASLCRKAVRALALVALGACDHSFEPIENSDLHFSIFGYLDASADTQWVRVMPVRPLILTTPERPEATVTLERLRGGSPVVLRDSIFRFTQHNQEVGSDGVFLHNFWTTERLEPGTEYRLTATRADGTSSASTVRIPADYHVEVWLNQSSHPSGLALADSLRVVGGEHPVFIRHILHFRDSCGAVVDTIIRRTRRPPTDTSDTYSRPAVKWSISRMGCGPPVVEKRELVFVVSGQPWPEEGLSPWSLNVPELFSNISNGLGFFGGVLSKLVPYEDCLIEGQVPPPQFCKLRYDDRTVVVRGNVTDARCGKGGVRDAVVRLEEILPGPDASRKVRLATTNSRGEYRISALEGGLRYAFSVDHPAVVQGPGNTPLYLEYADTMEFLPGEQVAIDVGLQRQGSC